MVLQKNHENVALTTALLGPHGRLGANVHSLAEAEKAKEPGHVLCQTKRQFQMTNARVRLKKLKVVMKMSVLNWGPGRSGRSVHRLAVEDHKNVGETAVWGPEVALRIIPV